MAQACVKDGNRKDARQILDSVKQKLVDEQSDSTAHQKSFEKRHGRKQYPGHELHHIFPRENRYRFHEAFVELGIDINHPENLMEIPNLVSDEFYKNIEKRREEVRQGKMSERELREWINIEASKDRAIHQGVFHGKSDRGNMDWSVRWIDFWQEHDLWSRAEDRVDLDKVKSLSRVERKRVRHDAYDLADQLVREADQHVRTDYKLSDFRGKAPY